MVRNQGERRERRTPTPIPRRQGSRVGEVQRVRESQRGAVTSRDPWKWTKGPKTTRSTSAMVRAVKGVANLIGFPALVNAARDWRVNEAVAALTDEERERTDRGHPP